MKEIAGRSTANAPLPCRSRLSLALLAALTLCTAGAAAAPQATANRAEARIQDMHLRLKIKAAEENQWKVIARVMRDNETAIEPLLNEREHRSPTMTAIDDLNSYADIAEAHAAGIRRFTTVFQPLYAAMSEDQRNDADTLFRKGPPKSSKK